MFHQPKIDLVPAVQMQTRIMAMIGLIAGTIYAGAGAVYDFLQGGLSVGTALAFLALLGMPALFAAFGGLSALVGGAFYNLIFARSSENP